MTVGQLVKELSAYPPSRRGAWLGEYEGNDQGRPLAVVVGR